LQTPTYSGNLAWVELQSPDGFILDNGHRGGVRHRFSGRVQRAQVDFVAGRWQFQVERRQGTEEPAGKIFVQVLLDVGRRQPAPRVMYGRARHGAIPIFVQNSYETSTAVISQPPGLPETMLVLLDDGLASPDVETGDGVRSQFFFETEGRGPYEVTLQFKKSQHSASVIRWTAPSMWIARPRRRVTASEDKIPPSMVTDLRAHFLPAERIVRLKWTATGDNLNYGQGCSLCSRRSQSHFTTIPAETYRIWCGSSPTAVSWDNCNAFSATLVRLAARAGTAESVDLPVADDFARFASSVLFVSVVVIDDSGNASPKSNLVSMLIPPKVSTTSENGEQRSTYRPFLFLQPRPRPRPLRRRLPQRRLAQ